MTGGSDEVLPDAQEKTERDAKEDTEQDDRLRSGPPARSALNEPSWFG